MSGSAERRAHAVTARAFKRQAARWRHNRAARCAWRCTALRFVETANERLASSPRRRALYLRTRCAEAPLLRTAQATNKPNCSSCLSTSRSFAPFPAPNLLRKLLHSALPRAVPPRHLQRAPSKKKQQAATCLPVGDLAIVRAYRLLTVARLCRSTHPNSAPTWSGACAAPLSRTCTIQHRRSGATRRTTPNPSP